MTKKDIADLKVPFLAWYMPNAEAKNPWLVEVTAFPWMEKAQLKGKLVGQTMTVDLDKITPLNKEENPEYFL